MTAAERLPVAYDDYLRAEVRCEVRHAFHRGEVFAMAGGSTVHALLAMEVGALFRQALVGRPCAASGADQRIHIDDENVTYADVVVLCLPIEHAPSDRHALTNPTALVEVLSPSTAAWDRGGKFALYATIPSLRHYVLVSQDCWRIEHYRRVDDGGWHLSVYGPGGVLVLDTLEVHLPVDDVYSKVVAFGGPSRDARPLPPR